MARHGLALALLALLLLQSCAVGLQQAAVLPWVRGNWAFSGTDLVVRDVQGGTLPIHVGADRGSLQDIGTVTQIVIAADAPFARVSIAPALTTSNNIEFIQMDMLYKHLISEEPGRRWWLLAGLGAMILNAGVAFTTHPTQNTVIAGRAVTPNDTIDYTARRDASGAYAVIGAQTELTGWCHGYVEALVRLTHGATQHESITMPVGGGASLDMTTSSTNLTVERTLQGTVKSDYDVPAFILAVGIQFNLPSYHVTRRFIRWHGGDPALDDAPPEPEEPVPPLPAAPTQTAP